MSDITLDRNFGGGDDILASQVRNTIDALDGTQYGRRNGVKAQGQDIGDPVCPMGTVYANALSIGGQLISFAQVARRRNTINSSRKVVGDSLPQFIKITDDNDAPSFTGKILAADAPLSVTIDGEDIIINRDIPFTVTPPPTTGNILVLNIGTTRTAATLRSTPDPEKYWGETDFAGRLTNPQTEQGIAGPLGSQAPAAKIIENNGKLVTLEYNRGGVKAYLFGNIVFNTEADTPHFNMFPVEREKFFDKDGNGIESQSLSGNNNLKLMQTSWLFINETSVDASPVEPIYSTREPSGAIDGQYWLDTVNQKWKRRTGGEFQDINRILVGIVISDENGLVGYRCLDTEQGYSNINTCQTAIDSEGKRLVANDCLVSVYGRPLQLSGFDWVAPEVPTGDSNRDRVTGLDANTYYYFYVTDAGLPEISKIRPRHRGDLQGYYHPFKSWRCVSRSVTDANSKLTTAGWLWLKYNPVGRIPLDLRGSDRYLVLGDTIQIAGVSTNRISDLGGWLFELIDWVFSNPPDARYDSGNPSDQLADRDVTVSVSTLNRRGEAGNFRTGRLGEWMTEGMVVRGGFYANRVIINRRFDRRGNLDSVTVRPLLTASQHNAHLHHGWSVARSTSSVLVLQPSQALVANLLLSRQGRDRLQAELDNNLK